MEASVQQDLNLALQHHQAGRLEKAITLYEQVIQRDPTNSDAHNLCGLAWFQKNFKARAIQLLQHATELRPEVVAFQENLANVLLHYGRFSEAESAYRRLLGLRSIPEDHNA